MKYEFELVGDVPPPVVKHGFNLSGDPSTQMRVRRRSLIKVSDRLPATIRDAIAVVQRLGCRYLWVDALCLVQNDTYDLDQGVKTMDLIYERAWLTIVAACGHDANARLPGAQYGTRKPSTNTCNVMPGITLGVVVGLDDLLGRSMYDTRGWTYGFSFSIRTSSSNVL
ncbi:hypothetical protein CEP53_002407 [Fusarium sp. AF-6]|nr:hypothetical protein CEP53_002407 [Fusarium sp. AF-6]